MLVVSVSSLFPFDNVLQKGRTTGARREEKEGMKGRTELLSPDPIDPTLPLNDGRRALERPEELEPAETKVGDGHASR